MKKDTITISVEAEKLRSIKKYMEKKDVDLEVELLEQIQKLYEKHVPANVREYIDDKENEENTAVIPKKTIKPSNKVITAE